VLEAEAEAEPERHRITLTVEQADAWVVELTRLLLRAVTGTRSSDALVEALLAEGMTTLQTVEPDAADAPIEHDPAAVARAEAWRMQLAAWRDEAERMVEGRVERGVALDEEALGDEATARGEATTAHELDARIRELCSELVRRDLQMGVLFDRFRRADGWRRPIHGLEGWATEEQYARERVGVSYASLKARLTLARRCGRLPAVAEALDGGRIGFEAASLVARVATPQTTDAWMGRAAERTIKHLREEIEGVEMLARASGDASILVPPSDEQVAAVAEVERWVLTGGVFAGEAVDLASADAPNDSQISVPPTRDAVNDSQMSVTLTAATRTTTSRDCACGATSKAWAAIPSWWCSTGGACSRPPPKPCDAALASDACRVSVGGRIPDAPSFPWDRGWGCRCW
jgi:hypothetical protein